MVVFGDSVSDDGTGLGSVLGPSVEFLFGKPYVGGRLSNGPVWVEHLADTFLKKAELLDFATSTANALQDEEVRGSLELKGPA